MEESKEVVGELPQPPSSKKNAKKNEMFIPENQVTAEFNEIDPENPEILLRTAEDFEIYLKDTNELIDFDSIEHYRGRVNMKCTILEPFPNQLKEQLASVLATAVIEGEDAPKAEPAAQVTEGQTDGESQPVNLKLDWSTLKIGDYVDGYCNKTFCWYEAKVVTFDEKKNRYKVHFQGWNSKYDEWIDKYSDRLIPHKASAIAVKEAAKLASQLVPWFASGEKLQNHFQQTFGINLQKKKSLKVLVEDIDDWCVDYTYANPTLWIIATSGIWYRVGGALCPTGCLGKPSNHYSLAFATTREKYLTASHVAMALMDILPNKPTANFKVIVDEVSVRTNHVVNELTILEHYQFLLDQISSIENPADWSANTSIATCQFLTQLHKEGEEFHSHGGMDSVKVN